MGPDERREVGHRTRNELLAATLELLAQRGQERVTLRGVTDKAGANVAAVSYHFGSLNALCESAIEQALEQYLDAQIQVLASLGPDPTLEELAAAMAAPAVHAIAFGGQELAVMRTMARAGIDPPRGWGRLNVKFDQSRQDILRVLKANLPDVSEHDLIFRVRCAAGMLNWLVLAPISAELVAESADEIERLITPVLAGAFRGQASRG
jgi:AcrR family transcriptional regulator